MKEKPVLDLANALPEGAMIASRKARESRAKVTTPTAANTVTGGGQKRQNAVGLNLAQAQAMAESVLSRLPIEVVETVRCLHVQRSRLRREFVAAAQAMEREDMIRLSDALVRVNDCVYRVARGEKPRRGPSGWTGEFLEAIPVGDAPLVTEPREADDTPPPDRNAEAAAQLLRIPPDDAPDPGE